MRTNLKSIKENPRNKKYFNKAKVYNDVHFIYENYLVAVQYDKEKDLYSSAVFNLFCNEIKNYEPNLSDYNRFKNKHSLFDVVRQKINKYKLFKTHE